MTPTKHQKSKALLRKTRRLYREYRDAAKKYDAAVGKWLELQKELAALVRR